MAHPSRGAPPAREPDTLTFIGTAITLLRRQGMVVLTDPNFLRRGQRADLGNGLWAKRLSDPAMSPQQLPALDVIDRRTRVVLIHYDDYSVFRSPFVRLP